MLINQLAKTIENAYKEKAILDYQLDELMSKRKQCEEQITVFEKTLGYLDPEFDWRLIRSQFDTKRLRKSPVFSQNVIMLLSQALKKNNHWCNLVDLTGIILELDGKSKYNKQTREMQCAVGRALRQLYKRGIVEWREVPLHGKIKKRGILQRTEWRLKPLEIPH